MLWSKELVIELIEMLKAAPALWDIQSKEYRDRNLKFDETSKIASHFKTNVDEVSRKIKSLKTQFSRERKKIGEKSKSGAATISEDNIWFGYNMMKFLVENNISKGSRSTFEQHTWYAVKYWMCEFLCLANIVLQVYWMNRFFGGEFITYGLRVIGMSTEHQDNRVDPMVFIFPRVTKCTFHKFGPSGTVQKHDSLCVLPLNIVNEKTYIFIWFWYLLLLAALVLMICHRVFVMCNATARKNALRYRHYRLITDDVAKAVTNKVSVGDWWVLYMLGKNLDPIIYREVVREIAKKADN